MVDEGPRRSRWTEAAAVTGADYDKAWARLEASGENPHGEADLVASLGPRSVLDAGCGTGRVAIELARRGIDVVGVDLDQRMLAAARRKAPELQWFEMDLSTLSIPDPDGADNRLFDLIVLAGNVMIFLAPGTESVVVERLAGHLGQSGLLVTGFQLRPGGLTLKAFDDHAERAGLRLQARYATWSRAPYEPGGDYSVSIHAREGA